MSTMMRSREDRSPGPSPATAATGTSSSLTTSSALLQHHRGGLARSQGGGSEHGGDASQGDSGLGASPSHGASKAAAATVLSPGCSPESDPSARAMEQIQGKIDRTKGLIRDEQASRDYNVNEYLKLSSSFADREQQVRIKQVFEKKNQKSSQNIAHYQKKLEEYQRLLQDIQENNVTRAAKSGQGGRDHQQQQQHRMGHGLKSAVMAKLMRQTFGSADDLSVAESSKSAKSSSGNPSGSSSLPRGLTPSSGFAAQVKTNRKCTSDEGRRSERSGGASSVDDETSSSSDDDDDDDDDHNGHLEESVKIDRHFAEEWNAVVQELTLHKEQVDHLREKIEGSKLRHKQESRRLEDQLREERDRYYRLEVQMNDLTELHQREIEGIRSSVGEMEEKVQYQREERLLDIGEQLLRLETKMGGLEQQQQAQQQQYLNIEGLDSSNAVVIKLLAAVIAIVQVVLFVIGSAVNLTWPFLRTGRRSACTAVAVLALSWAYVNQDTMWTAIQKFKEESFP